MSFDRYFREELAFLKEEGRLYSEIKPHLAAFLDGKNTDPDVERLLEGFAFLTSRLREKLDDDFPELSHSMINMLWPNYLRPFPSATMVQFTPVNDVISQRKEIDPDIQLAGAALESNIDCHFSTCRGLTIYPLVRTGIDVAHSRDKTIIGLQFETQNQYALSGINLQDLSFFLGESSYESNTLYLWFHHFLSHIEVVVGGQHFFLQKELLSFEGFESGEGLLPYPKNVYQGYRILHEYLVYPESLLSIKLSGLHKCFLHTTDDHFEIKFHFSKPLPVDIRINDRHLQIFCVPAINLFEYSAEPILLTGYEEEYLAIPSRLTPDHYEAFSFLHVTGWSENDDPVAGNNIKKSSKVQDRTYYPFETFQHEEERERKGNAFYYRTRIKENIYHGGLDHYISFSRSDESDQILKNETISIDMLCTNRFVPLELGKGDIGATQDTDPSYVTITNITEPTVPLHPVIDEKLLWMLISNLSLNYTSLLSKESLQTIIKAYDFKAFHDRQSEKITRKKINEGVISIETSTIDRIYRGLPVRGIRSVLKLDQNAFSCEGDLFLFSKVLSHFFALYASINSFHDLTVINITNNEKYEFPAMIGEQPLI